MQASEVGDYLEHVADAFISLGGTVYDGPRIALDFNEDVGQLRLGIEFLDSTRLEAVIVAAGPYDFPDWLDWRINFMAEDGSCIFRYDNAPHHHGTAFFPSHKHIGLGEEAVDHVRPSVAELVRELREHLYPDEAEDA